MAFPGDVADACTDIQKWHKKKNKNKNKKVTLHMWTHGVIWACGLTSLVVCFDDKFHDIKERNVAIRSEIWTTKICSLGFHDIRECDIMEVDITKFRVYMVNLSMKLS